ncbi:hypothetical protein VX037_15125 [Gordonia sp. Z-3]|uniref:ABC-2 type transport system permease protein n=1 Tax=Gordonia tangerina TaxID=2911060 RepID=A0ABS9DHN5_9ACTN|nr:MULTISPECIES: hypothetical protein [Gordonia]MCF3938720.1 hypothetical protein [Gordonia tangerina]MED5802362.1 hypothetical protein [Gordonia sp. Z-3]
MTATLDTRPHAPTPRVPGGGVGAMLRLQARTGWKVYLAWVAGLIAGYAATIVAIDGLYGTPELLATYGAAVGDDAAIAAINGTPYGADTLGGVAANEFAFIAAIAFPLMATHLVVRFTRAPEESGLLELMRSRSVASWAPHVAAVIGSIVAFGLVAAGMFVTLLAEGVPAERGLLYVLSLFGLGAVWTGLALCAAQWLRRARRVYTVSLILLGLAYAARAIGDVGDNAWKWLSPLAWQQETRPFADDMRWWPLLLAAAVAAVLIAFGVRSSATRDLGSGLVAARPGPVRATEHKRSIPLRAIGEHRGAIIGWTIGGLAVAVIFGSLAQQVADAVAGNPQIAQAFGADDDSHGIDTYLSLTMLILALMAAGYVITAIGRLRGDERTGLLEVVLAQAVSRVQWIGTQLAVILVGLVLVLLVPSVGLGAAVAVQVDDAGEIGNNLLAGLAYLPAVAVFAAVSVALFGWLPRAQPAVWGLLGYATFIGFLGGSLDWPEWLLRISPLYAVGAVPAADASGTAVVVLTVLTVALLAAGVIGFRRRDVPHP